ncbi:hypothetical protein [Frankia sp. Cj3]|uniref:hypothetical protein n=1 Tax=Frankia sp. Cj3 TaxID=2880976 RepID=UPI001EF72D63|nr:hypothetical protein [Frankia sp. Cj3]
MPGSITATVDATLARVHLVVTWTGGATSVTVTRLTSSTPTTPVRNGEPGLLTAGSWQEYDYEAPLDIPVYYQATDGSATAVSPIVTVPSDGLYWLRSPGRPALNITVEPLEDHASAMTRELTQGVFRILGREDPVVVSGRRYAPTSVLKFVTRTDDDRRKMRAILDDGQTLLYQTPGADAAGDDSGYVAVAAYDMTRVGYMTPERSVTLTVQYVGRPAGPAASGVGGTWADVLAAYSTWTGVTAAKATWQDLLDRIPPGSPPGGP